MSIHGFDVSHYQPAAPDFSQSNRQFAIIKATESTSYKDPHFAANRNKAHDQGMLAVGFYHFARPKSSTPSKQAQHFLNHIGSYRPGEFAVLDFEVDWNEQWAVDYLHFIQVEYPGPVVFYTYSAMLNSHPHSNIQATGCDLWIAKYSSLPPSIPGWKWTLWQHTDGQPSVSGNDGPWDCSKFYSDDPDDLRKWVGTYDPNPQPQPQPDPDLPWEVELMDFFILNQDGGGGIWAWFPELGNTGKGCKAIFHDPADVQQAQQSKRYMGDLTFTKPDIDGIPNLAG